MLSEQSSEGRSLGWLLLLTVLLSAAWFLAHGNVGLDLWDEGYLWHNVQRTYQGAVPIRDFRSYDPGRYYWGALWFHILGPGIMPLRMALRIFQMMGLFFGLWAVRRVVPSGIWLVPAGVCLLLWMFPSCRNFEHSLIMMAVFGAVSLIEKPNIARHFAAGVLVGVAAWFGRHLGVYLFFGFLLVIGFGEPRARIPDLARRYVSWGAGIVMGYLPMIMMLLFVPGFATAFFDSILRLFGPYAPVKPMPIPWPWALSFTGLSAQAALCALLLGIGFVILWTFYLGSLVIMVLSRRNSGHPPPLWAASFLMGIPLLHYINGRAEFTHFALGVHPLLIGLIALTAHAARQKQPVRTLLMLSPLVVLLTLILIQPQGMSMAVRRVNTLVRGEGDLVRCNMNGEPLWLDQSEASHIEGIRGLLATRLSANENILVAPFEAGLYPILQRSAPIWDPFPIHDAPPDEQKQSIIDLQMHNACWAIVDNAPLDGREELRFSKTHPALWEYLMNHFERVNVPQLSGDQVFLHKPSNSSM